MNSMRPEKALIVPVFALAFLAACGRNQEVQAARSTPEVPTVAVARVKTDSLTHKLALTAEFKPYQEVDVMAKVAGYVKEINVDIGDRVQQGALLATLEVPEMEDDLRRADAAVEQSKAEVQRASDELTRSQTAHKIAEVYYKRLAGVKAGLVAEQEIEDAQSKDLVAEAQVAAAKSAVEAANRSVAVHQADAAKVKTLMGYTQVTAPFTGVITARYADPGSMIEQGTSSKAQAAPVVRLSENRLLRLILPVPESAVPGVHIGQQVEVKVPTLKRSFPGKVVRFSDKLSVETRTMATEVDVQNPSLVLVPGMYAEVDLTLARHANVLAVPVTAVDTDTSASGEAQTGRVMVVTPNNRVEVRKIQLGLETADEIEVVSGLNEGDMVVIGGRSSLQAGEEVKPKVTVMGAAS